MKQHKHISQLPESQISKLNALSFLSPDHRYALLNSGQFISLGKNTYLFSQDEPADHFFIVLSGAVKLIKTASNDKATSEETLLEIIGPGGMIGGPLMLIPQKAVYPASAKAMGETEVFQLNKSFFNEYWQKHPELSKYTFEQTAERLRRLQMDRCMQRLSLEKKVAYYLAEKIAPLTDLRITRQEIADAVGASQESIIRLLSDWEDKGYIRSQNQRIYLNNLEQMKKIWQES